MPAFPLSRLSGAQTCAKLGPEQKSWGRAGKSLLPNSWGTVAHSSPNGPAGPKVALPWEEQVWAHGEALPTHLPPPVLRLPGSPRR